MHPPGVVAADGCFVVTGGENATAGQMPLVSVEAYDPRTKRWCVYGSERPSMAVRRFVGSTLTLTNSVCVCACVRACVCVSPNLSIGARAHRCNTRGLTIQSSCAHPPLSLKTVSLSVLPVRPTAAGAL